MQGSTGKGCIFTQHVWIACPSYDLRQSTVYTTKGENLPLSRIRFNKHMFRCRDDRETKYDDFPDIIPETDEDEHE